MTKNKIEPIDPKSAINFSITFLIYKCNSNRNRDFEKKGNLYRYHQIKTNKKFFFPIFM